MIADVEEMRSEGRRERRGDCQFSFAYKSMRYANNSLAFKASETGSDKERGVLLVAILYELLQ